MDESIDAAAREANRALLGRLPADRTLVMGILNVTPDSFSDGGEHATVRAAVEHARRMVADGADIVDVGGESTRPGARAVPPAEEQARILPVIEALLAEGVVVSVDTRHTATARAALALGPVIVNDVSGLAHEPEMPALIAASGAPYILMHNRGNPQTMDGLAVYEDTVPDVVCELRDVAGRFLAAGVEPAQLIVDPGLGFAKAGEQNWELLRGLEWLRAMGHPVLVAASRKRFLGTLLADDDGAPAPPAARDAATAAISAL
ncbi:dihydropteroate synthase, partial [Micrococcus luteus]|uniref:dihydropteroate synthase n=4 Tax=Micrococcaceae TaxID=1268 RepID=UPI0019D2332E|nr:dihydropteroate synthase [Micrococcus luteus]